MKTLLMIALISGSLIGCSTTGHLLDGESGWIADRQFGTDTVFWCTVKAPTGEKMTPTCFEADMKKLSGKSIFKQ